MTLMPVQSFLVPLRADDLTLDFDAINSDRVDEDGFFRSIVSISVAAPGTVIWYDHWEDGYDTEYTLITGGTTSIWGDSDTSNDRLLSFETGLPMGAFQGGEAIILENTVGLPRDPSELLYDGGDRIVVSYPVAVTRSAYPTDNGDFDGDPGSLLAGAVEVFATERSGTEFIVPVGTNTADTSGTNPFELARVHVMAARDNTEVFLNGASQGTIDTGQVIVLDVQESAEITASNRVQASLVTGDIDSNFEMRWYALAPREQWASDYIAPYAQEGVNGATRGSTGFWFHNPNSGSITIDVSYQGAINADTFVVAANSTTFIEIDDNGDINLPNTIGEKSGMRFVSQGGEDFFVVSQVDAEGDGKTHDWGHPLIPTDQLTSQALVGLGYGNTSNDPNIESYSRVFVTPIEAATIFVDFNSDGTPDLEIEADALEMVAITDPNDSDMSGATIFARHPQNGEQTVNIAVAWGQDPSITGTGSFDQTNSLDLGTLVLPLPEITAGKSVSLQDDVDGDGEVDPGDTLEWTITVVNFGIEQSPQFSYRIIDDEGSLLPGNFSDLSDVFDVTSYVPGSTTYSFDDDGTPTTIMVDDDMVGATLFPLDGAGVLNSDVLEGRDGVQPGETQLFRFRTIVKDLDQLPAGTDSVTNVGALFIGDLQVTAFDADIPIPFKTSIQIEKATNGQDADTGPGPVIAIGNDVTWTYDVWIPETGENVVPLADIELIDDAGTPGNTSDDLEIGAGIELIGGDDGDNVLEPGEVWQFEATGTASEGQYVNIATVSGTPVYASDPGVEVEGLSAQEDTDPSHYFGIPLSYTIQKEVTDVNGDRPLLVDGAGDVVGYEIIVQNTGDGPLTGVVVSDPLLEGANGSLSDPVESLIQDGILQIGESWTYTGSYEAQQVDLDTNGGGDGDIDNTATVTSNELPPESASADVPILVTPQLLIDKRVVDVDGRGPAAAVTAAGQVITYDIDVTNDGNVTLTNVTVTDPLTGTDVNVGDLAPGETKTVEDQTYAVLQSDLDDNGGGDGDIDNTATAGSDQTDEETDSEEVPIEEGPPPTPGLLIDKRVVDVDGRGPAAAVTAAGQVITYDIDVTNDGNVTLTNVTVTDPLTGTDVNVGDLAPGETKTVEDQTYAVLQSDLDDNGGGDGDIDNTATADSDQTDEETDSEEVPLRFMDDMDDGDEGDDCKCDIEIVGIQYEIGTDDTDDINLKQPGMPNGATGLGDGDYILGSDVTNHILGNSGNDYLRGEGGADLIEGGTGNDVIAGDGIDTTLAEGDCLYGDEGDDIIAGNEGADSIEGGEGMDLLFGNDGDDCIHGGTENDCVFGGVGDDSISGDDGDDDLFGQNGDDTIHGGLGADIISGGHDNDALYGEDGDDFIAGNEGHDFVFGGDGRDKIWGGDGMDGLRGGKDEDYIDGQDGDDFILGQRANDTLLGGEGNDVIRGGGGDDVIAGGDDNDIISGNDNQDCISGGAGDDKLWGDNATGKGAVSLAADTIDGGIGNDTIMGGNDDDHIRGNDDDDDLFGQDGDDIMSGGNNDDRMSGGADNDQMSGDAGDDNMIGDGGNDLMSGGGDDDRMKGATGDDTMCGGANEDSLMGDGNDDYLMGDYSIGTVAWEMVDGEYVGHFTPDMNRGGSTDHLEGNLGNDTLFGGAGDDRQMTAGEAGYRQGDDAHRPDGDGNDFNPDAGATFGGLYGGLGNDVLLGGEGNDELFGEKNQDCLIADAGSDTLWGGDDGDDFVFGHNLVARDPNGELKVVAEIAEFDVRNVVKDFSSENDDCLVFHTAHEGAGENGEGILQAALINNDGDAIADDIAIGVAGSSVIVEDLWSELGLQTISEEDPLFFPDLDAADLVLRTMDNAEFRSDLMDYLLETFKGVIKFEDKEVEIVQCDPETPDPACEIVEMPEPEGVCVVEGDAGDTLPKTTGPAFVNLYFDEDDYARYTGDNTAGQIDWDLGGF